MYFGLDSKVLCLNDFFLLLYKNSVLQILFYKFHNCKFWKYSEYLNVLNFSVWCILGTVMAFNCLIFCPYLFCLCHKLKVLSRDYLTRCICEMDSEANDNGPSVFLTLQTAFCEGPSITVFCNYIFPSIFIYMHVLCRTGFP